MTNTSPIPKYSRRTVLVGAAGVTVFTTAKPTVTALPTGANSFESDAELLCRIETAKRFWEGFVAAKEISERLLRVTWHHMGCANTTRFSVTDRVKFNKLADQLSYRDAADYCERLHEQYGEAMDEAFSIPANTLRGFYAKLKFASERARAGDTAAYLGTEFEWLDFAIADLERLAV